MSKIQYKSISIQIKQLNARNSFWILVGGEKNIITLHLYINLILIYKKAQRIVYFQYKYIYILYKSN